MGRDELNELLTSAVANAEPDDFGWMAVKQTPLLKIRVLRDDGKAVGVGILPNVLVRSPSRPHSRTCALSGKSVASKRGSLGERFSSKSNFMRDDVQAAVTVCGERKARLDVVGGEVGKVIEHLGNGHAATEIIENVGHGDARAADAGLAAADARINRDAFSVVHVVKVVFWAS